MAIATEVTLFEMVALGKNSVQVVPAEGGCGRAGMVGGRQEALLLRLLHGHTEARGQVSRQSHGCTHRGLVLPHRPAVTYAHCWCVPVPCVIRHACTHPRVLSAARPQLTAHTCSPLPIPHT